MDIIIIAIILIAVLAKFAYTVYAVIRGILK